MQSELGKIKRHERDIKRKSQEDAHKYLADIIESSERMLNAIDLFEKNGGDLFKRQLKHSTKSYRKILFAELNKVYDFMETAGVGDGFLMTVKANSFLQGLIGNMTAEQRNKLILSAEEIMNDKQDVIVSEKENVEVESINEDVVHDRLASNDESFNHIELDDINWDEDELEDNEPFVNPLDKILEEQGLKHAEETSELKISLNVDDVDKITADFATQGKEVDYEVFFLNKVIEMNNIDTDLFVFSEAKVDDNNYVLTFKNK